ncbi:NADPH-dependent F420 reductase [Sphingopyxis sp. GW247-27LB]|uniref:NADPH-dependent F420 reductase n=1 Tax=Sphingopyxis sp. GW247-27LB TaxID=2012632 RepID=UPI000BA71B24|nr:NADPH-dependent F420 reductase [Sphingopyxis sp. GW247-27LB]PAL21484.1 NADPH-dependent F420 reductase [Sphingopyxis sp. GW247-27LB]
MTPNPRTIAILGGAGKEGSGLALRWGYAGHRVLIGSRSAERAEAAASELNAELATGPISGMTNGAAAAAADLVVLTVPYAAQQETAMEVATELAGKILVDVTAPLKPPRVSVVQLPEGGSAAVALQERLGDMVTVVAAFQNISAHHLRDLDHVMDCDVLVSADDADDADQVIALVNDAGMKGWHSGPLANSAAAEALTSVLIALNRRYKVPGSGIRITGIE